MTEIVAIGAIGEVGGASMATPLNDIQPLGRVGMNALSTVPQPAAGDFSILVTEGLAKMDAKVAHADQMVTRFALDDSVPVHQVTIALEEARLSVEMAMQVRQRFVEGYRELMNMQL